ncbi:MAG: dockerin type I domain-containing protein [Eubacteriales bacterium]|nr:dockerin type I domain-containing protein [Eubacteriales bacterium]
MSILPFGVVWANDYWGYQPEILGDSNLDGVVTAADASLILRYLVHLVSINDNYQFAHMDTDENGQITAADASHILRYIVKLGKLPFDSSAAVTIAPSTATPVATTAPRVTPTPTAAPTASPTPSPEPYLSSDAGLILHANDPYFAQIMNFYEGHSYSFTSGGTSYTIKTDSTHCKDIIGWIYMSFSGLRNDGTTKQVAINYPIMYAADLFYTTHNEDGDYIASGSISSLTNSLQVNNVISGHNSRPNKWRFYDLHTLQNKIKSEAFNGKSYQNYDFKISLYGYYDWRVWAMYETPADEPDSTQLKNLSYNCQNNVSQWIEYQLSRSEVDFQVSVSNTDKFITLETCGDIYDSDVQSRLYIFLVRMT